MNTIQVDVLHLSEWVKATIKLTEVTAWIQTNNEIITEVIFKNGYGLLVHLGYTEFSKIMNENLRTIATRERNLSKK